VSRQRPFLIVDNSDVQDAYDCLAVCVVSLEDVARITSQLGSEAAGAAHAEFASRLHSLLRREDQLIQIHEGKHCLVLRQLKDLNHAVLAGMKIERLFGEAVTVRGHPLHLKVRAGIACAEVGASDPEDLFRAAETAREAACALQTAFQLAEDDVVADMQHRWKLNDDVDGAIAEHHLKLYYQPKVSAVTHRLVGAEGLIRWIPGSRR
jgi:predicted signal transduction protein with EAL and GGDEF domain